MNLTKNLKILLAVNVLAISAFTLIALKSLSYEFILYIAVIIFFAVLLYKTHPKVQYPDYLLWMLSLWGLLHMAGGLLYARGDVWYNLILIPLSDSLQILKYDQMVHMFGFFAATILVYVLLRPHLKNPNNISWALGIILVAAGSGLGAWNEIIEFFAQASIKEANVGGYLNTSLDTIANLIGSLLALVFIKKKYK